MTIENSNLKPVVLTAEQYSKILFTLFFITELCDLIDNSSIDIDALSVTPLLSNAALDLKKTLCPVND